MTPARYQRICELFDEALERAPAERAGWLRQTCGAEVELLAAVENLLAHHRADDDFLSRPALHAAAAQLAQQQSTSLAPSLAGQVISHYQVLSLLGAGGMGEVWLARDTRLDRQVALKLLPAAFTLDAGRVQRFTREAQAASALNHPNILTIYDVGQADGRHFIATEYIEGETLRARLSRERLPWATALGIAIQIAGALAVAHKAGILHRDIKPENVMLRTDGIVKVLDFGLAKLTELRNADFGLRNEEEDAATLVRSLADNPQSAIHHPQLTLSGTILGTASYMSPEQARGQQLDARTDIFSLGVLLYEMLAGCQPFSGATTREIVGAILHQEPAPLAQHWPAAPGELQHIVTKALCKDRTQRYQTSHELLSELRQTREQHALNGGADGALESVAPLAAATSAVPPMRATQPSGKLSLRKLREWLPRQRLLVLTALLVAACATFFSFVRGRQTALTEQDTLLLAELVNRTGEPVFDRTLRQGLAVQLEQSPWLNFLSEQRVRETLKQMTRSPDEPLTPEIGREICVRQGLKALIRGELAPLGNHYVVTLEALAGQTGDTLARAQSEAASKEQVLHALGAAASRLRERLGESLQQVRRFDKPIEQATTSSLEALQAYSLGVEHTKRGEYLQSLPAYQRAVELDPQFALAWLALARQSYNTVSYAQATQAAHKAYELRDRVTENERLHIINFYHLGITGDLEQAINNAELWRQTYPNNWQPYHSLSDSYYETGQYELSVERGRAAVQLNPDAAAAYSNPAGALYGLERFDEAKTLYQQALARGLDAPEYHAFLFRIASIQGDQAELEKQLAWSATRKDWSFNMRALWLAQRGQWRAAREHTRKAQELFAQTNVPDLVKLATRYEAVSAALLGDCRTAENGAQALATANLEFKAQAAIALALCGKTARATTMAAELRAQHPQNTIILHDWSPVIAAAVALARHEPERVLTTLPAQHPNAAALTNLTESWPPWLRGQAWLQKGEGAQAAVEFRSLLEHRGRTYWQIFWPLAHLGLARALALTGDVPAARQAYQNFFAVWKDADAELPILKQARREVEQLR